MSSTSLSTPSAATLPRNRRPTPAHPLPPISFPSSLISDLYSPALSHESLRILARKLATLDQRALSIVQAICLSIQSGRLNAGDTASQAEARRNLDDIQALSVQFGDITEGRRAFGEGYLRDRHMIYFWAKALSFGSQAYRASPEDPLSKAFEAVMGGLVRELAMVEDCLVAAAGEGVLEDEVMYTVGERWSRAEGMAGVFGQSFVEWAVVAQKLREAQPKPTKPTVNIWMNISLLWTTFAVTAVSNVVFFALGCIYSPHKPGTPEDADFWFLLQSCVSQFFGLAWLAIPLWHNPHVPRRSWIAMVGVAAVCTVVAAPLYLYVPTEWSTFVASTGGAIQAFLSLQLAIAA
ncbi:hypothetical protein B0J18DRAFT_425155 [Chaetomium sp. MPI-SDFR-AT-0129]|nr:hypothetical protein B0J18DRAFT_425155 [Chaetomium sp. MPI-SDFR-AT-0129]